MRKQIVLDAAIAFLVLVHPAGGQPRDVNDAPAQEFSAWATGGPVELRGALLLPRTANPARGVIVVAGVDPGMLGQSVYEDPPWRRLAAELRCALLGVGGRDTQTGARPAAEQGFRNAAVGGGDAVLRILSEIARQSGHPELNDAKLVLWGGSAGGSFVATLAAMQPERTIAFIRYHSHARGLLVDVKTLAQIPALIFAGRKDERAGVEDSEAFLRSGRTLHAPWTLAIDPDATHMSRDAIKKANELAIPWVRAVFAARVAENGAPLRRVDETSGWFASSRDGEVAPAASFRGPKEEASWLPDEASVEGWRAVSASTR